MATIDCNWHIGVCGWQVDGRHVRLAEVVAVEGEVAIRRHLGAMILLRLVLLHMESQLCEIE